MIYALWSLGVYKDSSVEKQEVISYQVPASLLVASLP
jgi:hypothetical protein